MSHAVPAPLRLSLLSDLRAIVMQGCMDGPRNTMHTQTSMSDSDHSQATFVFLLLVLYVFLSPQILGVHWRRLHKLWLSHGGSVTLSC